MTLHATRFIPQVRDLDPRGEDHAGLGQRYLVVTGLALYCGAEGAGASTTPAVLPSAPSRSRCSRACCGAAQSVGTLGRVFLVPVDWNGSPSTSLWGEAKPIHRKTG